MNVTLDQVYAEACKALGEAVVAQRMLQAEVARLQEAQEAAQGTAETAQAFPTD